MSGSSKSARDVFFRTNSENCLRPTFIFYLAGAIVVLALGATLIPRKHPASIPQTTASKVETGRAIGAGANLSHAQAFDADRPLPLEGSRRIHPTSTPREEGSSNGPRHSAIPDTIPMISIGEESPLGNSELLDKISPSAVAQIPATADPIAPAVASTSFDPQGKSPTDINDSTQVYLRPAQNSAQSRNSQLRKFLPLGHAIPVCLVRAINTTDAVGLVELAVAENVVFNHQVQLPFGTRIYGKAGDENVSDRIVVSVNTIVYPDGSQKSIAGVVLDVDGLPGLRGYYIPQPVGVQAFPYLNEAAIGILESRRSGTDVTISGGDLSAKTGKRLKNDVTDGAERGIEKALARKQKELDRRYPAYVLVKAGSPGWIQLSGPLELTTQDTLALSTTSRSRDILGVPNATP